MLMLGYGQILRHVAPRTEGDLSTKSGNFSSSRFGDHQTAYPYRRYFPFVPNVNTLERVSFGSILKYAPSCPRTLG